MKIYKNENMQKEEMQMKEEEHSISWEIVQDKKKENRFLLITNIIQTIIIAILIISTIFK